MWEKYISDVLTGKRLTGELERLSVERFEALRNDPRFYFDKQHVETMLHIVSHFRHTKGEFRGVPFNILPWQAFVWAWIFGLKHRSDELRVTREWLLCMSKKGGKSEFGGATAVLMTFFDNEPKSECYSAANSLDQAEFSWSAGAEICKQLREDDEEFASVCRVFDSVNNRKIVDLSDGSFFKTIAAENKTLDGTNAQFGLLDEIHEAKDDKIPQNLRSGMVQRRQPLLMYVTTRGFNPNSVLARLERKHIALMRNQAQDPATAGMIFAFDPEDERKLKEDWGKPVELIDKTYWGKSNPGLGIAPSIRGVESMYTDAINAGASEMTNVWVKNFNIWTRQSKTWFDYGLWRDCSGDVDFEALKGKMCFGAIDLSTRWDLTCFGLLFPIQEGIKKNTFIASYFCPQDSIEFRARRDKVPYIEWEAQGWLTSTPGNVIDYDYIREAVLAAGAMYDVQKVMYDPMFATETATKLYEAGIQVEAMKQTVYQYNESLLKIEEWAGKKELNKGQCPILDWMFENVAIRRNSSGLMMFDKEHNRERIDGMVTLAMCIKAKLDYDKDATNHPGGWMVGWVSGTP